MLSTLAALDSDHEAAKHAPFTATEFCALQERVSSLSHELAGLKQIVEDGLMDKTHLAEARNDKVNTQVHLLLKNSKHDIQLSVQTALADQAQTQEKQVEEFRLSLERQIRDFMQQQQEHFKELRDEMDSLRQEKADKKHDIELTTKDDQDKFKEVMDRSDKIVQEHDQMRQLQEAKSLEVIREEFKSVLAEVTHANHKTVHSKQNLGNVATEDGAMTQEIDKLQEHSSTAFQSKRVELTFHVAVFYYGTKPGSPLLRRLAWLLSGVTILVVQLVCLSALVFSVTNATCLHNSHCIEGMYCESEERKCRWCGSSRLFPSKYGQNASSYCEIHPEHSVCLGEGCYSFAEYGSNWMPELSVERARTEIRKMDTGSWIAYLLSALVVSSAIGKESFDIIACHCTKRKQKLSLLTNAWFYVQRALRQYSVMIPLIIVVVRLVIYSGSSALNICLNSCALVFILDMDDVIFEGMFHESVAEELARVHDFDIYSKNIVSMENSRLMIVLTCMISLLTNTGSHLLWSEPKYYSAKAHCIGCTMAVLGMAIAFVQSKVDTEQERLYAYLREIMCAILGLFLFMASLSVLSGAFLYVQ